MNTMKKVVVAFLCMLFLGCMVFPVSAYTGSIDCYKTHDYVKAHCTGTLTTSSADIGISLAFIPGVDHYPPSDYYCRAVTRVISLDGRMVVSGDTLKCGMDGGTAGFIYDGSISGADFLYKVNGAEVHYKSYGTIPPEHAYSN